MADVDKLHSNAGTGPGDMSRVSNMLHTARERAGIELSDVAERLRIRLAYLEAIEEARFGDLPGPTYALGFVRAYADFLELDGREIVRQFKGEGQGLTRRQELIFPEPIQEGRFPGAQILVTALVLAGLVYGGWYYWQHRRAHPFAEVSPVPSNLAILIKPKPGEPATSSPPSPAPGTEPAPAPAPKASEPATSSETSVTQTAPSTAASNVPTEAQDTAPLAPTPLASSQASSTSSVPGMAATTGSKPTASGSPSASDSSSSAPSAAAMPKSETLTASTQPAEAPKPSVTKPTPVPTASVKPAPAKPEAPKTTSSATSGTPSDQQVAAKTNEAHVFGETEGISHVTLIARQDSWLQVRDKSGQVLMTRILRAGDSYKVPNDPGLTLATGNAGALEVTVDGREVPALGSAGAVRRNISLDPSKLVAGTATGQ